MSEGVTKPRLLRKTLPFQSKLKGAREQRAAVPTDTAAPAKGPNAAQTRCRHGRLPPALSPRSSGVLLCRRSHTRS